MQSVLNTAGTAAREVETLTWALFIVLGAAYVWVLVVYARVLFQRRREERTSPREASQRLWLGVSGIAIPVVVLTGILVATLGTMRVEANREDGEPDIVMNVVGKQWWWDVYYESSEPQLRLHTANEIHLPAGRSVLVKLDSHDVIHSFWVPALQGKIDMVPGRRNELWIRAEKPGVYRGQCAEFCGLQHTKMALVVVVHEAAEFEEWYRSQLAPAAEPTDSLAREGMRVFLDRPCALCHAVRGTPAGATAGPDLTHLASRRTLAAGTLENNRGNLGGWITNPQRIKPGAHMPNVDLTSHELHALLAYLETLR